MCGIAGYLGSRPLDPSRIRHCLSLMGRRGPDHAAFYEHRFADDRRVYLLHSRLSIIDLDPRSNQPFRRGSLALIFNGELYNYLELKADLIVRGRTFETTSDTEVLITALDEFGSAGLDRGEGMWALALYDERDGSLLLSRDRFGEKPLYYYQTEEGLYFGSEIKFIFALSGRRLPVDFKHLYRYLVNGYKNLYKVADNFFEGIEELPPATNLRLTADGERTFDRYWTPDFGREDPMTFDEAVAGVRRHLIEAVNLRLRADVPLAFCMSGGIDSNALISIAKNLFAYDVQGFTILNTDERYDEKDLVDLAVADQKLRHTYIPIDTRGFLPRLRELVGYHDAPVITITYFAHWLLMESIARHGYRISVSGTAADEFFSGYFDHHNFYLAEMAGEVDAYRTALADWQRFIGPIVRNPFLKDPECFLKDPDFREHIYLDAPQFAAYLEGYSPEPFFEERYRPGLLRNRLLNELFHEAVPPILHEDDLNAMYFSIENRSPFLDRQLFEFSLTIPTRHLIREGRAKAVLREAMRGIVPDPILDNPRKVGFNAPIFDFLDVKDPAVRREILADSPIYDHLKRENIAALLDRDSLPNSESKFLFYFLSAKMFLENFT